MVEAATAFTARVQRHGAICVNRVGVESQVFSEQTGDARRRDANMAVLEVVNDLTHSSPKLIGRSHAVEFGRAESALPANLRNARACADNAVRSLQRRQAALAIFADVISLTLADYAVFRKQQIQKREGCSL